MRRVPGRDRREDQYDPERPDPTLTECVNNQNTDKLVQP